MYAVFILEATAEVRKLKICRYCDKLFIAVNPNTGYDMPQIVRTKQMFISLEIKTCSKITILMIK